TGHAPAGEATNGQRSSGQSRQGGILPRIRRRVLRFGNVGDRLSRGRLDQSRRERSQSPDVLPWFERLILSLPSAFGLRPVAPDQGGGTRRRRLGLSQASVAVIRSLGIGRCGLGFHGGTVARRLLPRGSGLGQM